jgi:tetratricopeptide (TPR) repeat protein
MSSFPRSAPVATILFLSLRLAVLGDDTNAPAIPPELAAADQLYRAGKFAEAESSYQAVLKNDSNLVPMQLMAAEVGVVRAMLRQQKIDEALAEANSALAAHPNSAALLAAKGDVQFRNGEMPDAELSYLAAKKLDRRKCMFISDWGGCTVPILCIAKHMISYRMPMRSLLTISRCRGHGYGCFRGKKDLQQWRPT